MGRFTRYDFVAYDKLTTRLRHELLRVNQTYNSLNGPKSCRRPVVSLSYAMKSYRNNLAPAYLCNLFLPRIPSYDFRNAKKKLLLPKPRTDYLKHSFSYSGAILWNNLPEEIRTSNSLAFFKRSYNKLFSDQYSHTANM